MIVKLDLWNIIREAVNNNMTTLSKSMTTQVILPDSDSLTQRIK